MGMMCSVCGVGVDSSGVVWHQYGCNAVEREFPLVASSPDPRDAEIARLKAEVERLRESDADLIQTIFDAGQRVGIEPADLSPTEVLTKMADDLAAHKRALAAGPAALRLWGDIYGNTAAIEVERAQAEAMDAGMTDDTIESLRAERDLLFDALNLHLRSTGITTEAMSRVDAFRAVVEASEPQVRGECGRLEKGWNGAADQAKRAEIERDAALAACADLRAALEEVLDEIMETWATCDVLLIGRGNTVSSQCVDRLRALLARTDLGAGMVVVPREVVERLREAAMGEIMISPKALADLDALLKKGGG